MTDTWTDIELIPQDCSELARIEKLLASRGLTYQERRSLVIRRDRLRRQLGITTITPMTGRPA